MNHKDQRLTRRVYLGLVIGLLGIFGICATNALGQTPPCTDERRYFFGSGTRPSLGLVLEFLTSDVSVTSGVGSEASYFAQGSIFTESGTFVTVYTPIVPCPPITNKYVVDALGGAMRVAAAAFGLIPGHHSSVAIDARDNFLSVLPDFGARTLAAAPSDPAGTPSIVAVDANDNFLYFLQGLGSGTYAAPVSIPTNSFFPVDVTVGDFNGDGNPDVAVLNNCSEATCTAPGNVSIFLGNGDGTFQPAVSYYVGFYPVALMDTIGSRNNVPLQFSALLQADFNGEGKQDIVVVNQGDSTVSILLGNGDGTFQTERVFGAAATPTDVMIGDFNGDGKLDLAVAAAGPFPGVVSILLGNGDGTFQTHVDYAVGNSPISLTAADFNLDGKLDLAAANGNSNSVSVLLGNGDGTFQPQVAYSSGGVTPLFVTSYDDNGDGVPDIIVSNQGFGTGDSNVVTLLGKGDGKFEASTDYATGSSAPPFPDAAEALATADLNGDGKLDFVATHGYADTVSVLLNNGDGTFAPTTTLATPYVNSGVAIADFNGDGKPDVAVTNGGSQSEGGIVSVFLGNGNGSFQPAVNFGVFGNPLGIVTGDFNGDGKLDIATASQSRGVVSVLLGNGNGTFQSVMESPLASFPYALVAGDFNNDGKLDLAVANLGFGAASVSILIGNGDGTFQPHVDYAVPLGAIPPSLAAGDFNGDGNLDLAVISGNGVSVFLGKGDGTFQPNVDYPAGFTSSPPNSVIAHDINGDGILDLEVTSPNNTVSVLVGNGDGTFLPPAHFGIGGNGDTVVAGDFIGNGLVDLAVARADGTVSVFLNSLAIDLVPNNLTFGNQPLGATSPAQTATVWNPGPAPLSLGAIQATGDFAQTNTCGASLAVEATCAVSVTFTPTGTGALTGSLTITDGAPNSPHTIFLNGTGTVPVVSLSSSALTFSPQIVGTRSSAQTVTLTNTGSASLAISSTRTGGDFSQTNTCGTTVSAGANCTISVTFKPIAAGTRTGTLSISDNASGSPQMVALSGTGLVFTTGPHPPVVQPPPVNPQPGTQPPSVTPRPGRPVTPHAPLAAISSSSLTFSPQTVGISGSALTVTLSNTGDDPLTISGITASGDFSQTNTCETTLSAGADCTISVTFKPRAAGAGTGTLSISDDPDGSPETVALSGTGVVSTVGPRPAVPQPQPAKTPPPN